MVINSTPDNIVFTPENSPSGKSVLFLPPLGASSPFLHFIENTTKEGDFIPDNSGRLFNFSLFNDFTSSLNKVMKNLEDGYYIIEFYFYLEDELNVHNTVTVVYTYDFFNKKCLNQVMGNFGYSNFSFFLEYFSEKNRRENCVMIIILMTERLRVILENKSAINFNKDTLVVITKSSKEGYEGRDSLINLKYNTPGLNLTGIKRY